MDTPGLMMAGFSDESVASSIHEPITSNDRTEGILLNPQSTSDNATFKTANTTTTFSRESEAKLMDSVIVNNEKVRYYYNKTLCLREPLGNILDTLEVLHSSTFAYLSQVPETGDYSIISSLFELIPTLSVMIDWDNLNHSCYWEDFCRETKQLMYLLGRVNGAALKCSDTATSLLQQAQDLFHSTSNDKRLMKTDGALAFRKESDYIHENASGQSIQINWQRLGNVVELMWHDADGGLLNVSLNQTGTGFRIRFLRHIIYHARSLLEKSYLLFMKLNVALHLHIPMDKLLKCKDVNLKILSHQEHACLMKAKREFDSSLHLIWQTILRFKFQTFRLLEYEVTFKAMRKASGYSPKVTPSFAKLKISVDDSLLMRVISTGIQAQANEESFDFTVFPDRTEDILAKVEDLLAVDNSNYKELHLLLSIVRVILPLERFNFTKKEKQSTNDEIARILAHRFQVRRSLKKALQIFEKHAAFYNMEQIKILTPVTHVSRKVHSFDVNVTDSSGGSETQLEDMPSSTTGPDSNNNANIDQDKIWISIEGGVKVTMDGRRGILTTCPVNGNSIKEYSELNTDEKVILCARVIRQLLVCIANEQCLTKIASEKILETKSLVKRLKIKDRQNPDLQKVILEQNKHLRSKLQLTKAMRFLKNVKMN